MNDDDDYEYFSFVGEESVRDEEEETIDNFDECWINSQR